MLQAGWRLEASQALYIFLTRLQQPLIPHSIQSLVLDDNGNVPPEIIATDVLGLLKQELSENHLALTSLLLNLLDNVIKVSPADELRGNTLPTSMLPLFFNVQNRHISEWRRIATIFVEVIRHASQALDPCFACDQNNVPMSNDVNSSELIEGFNQLISEPVDLFGNAATRRYLAPAGFRGDCYHMEVYHRNNHRQ
ncbi:unnamed protein product [Acanthoscelides obtectus]|uniref:Uncharacterized protein n=1 Tax=Acanthoscelides obtectus TaxID=200917 RepID=A0A9P0P2H7_ACAOB|nr:unnamed protein product [Acanthoscelides obtectus]CAK1620228.1 hypothetical protein AOBTE_LOCUS250 [Acanthoscelides obtectus]